jgi:hypothetical protein
MSNRPRCALHPRQPLERIDLRYIKHVNAQSVNETLMINIAKCAAAAASSNSQLPPRDYILNHDR